MTKIKYDPASAPSAVLDAVRRSLTSRDYHWQPEGELKGVASEGGQPIDNKASSHRLQLSAEVDPGKRQVVLKQRTNGAAYAGAGVPFFMVRLNFKFAKVVKAVRADLESSRI